MVEQFPRHPGVLAGDYIGRREGLQRPERDVAEVADRGGDEMQTGREPRRLDRLAGMAIRPGPVLGSVFGSIFGHRRIVTAAPRHVIAAKCALKPRERRLLSFRFS